MGCNHHLKCTIGFKLLVVLVFTGFSTVYAQTKTSNKIFIANPYLQIGNTPSSNSLQVLWQAPDANGRWGVEYKPGADNTWLKAEKLNATKIAVSGVETHFVYRAAFTHLMPGSDFAYRILRNKKEVFTAFAKAPRSAEQPFRFVVFGDIGAGTPEAKQIANGVFNAKPDIVFIPGDIVYDYGLIKEYQSRFWPIYNADKVDTIGVPLMCSIPFVAAVGNHDAVTRDLDKHPDALAYYYYWNQPLNGPEGKEGGALVPKLYGSDANKNAFKSGAGNRYPRMSNFSFDYANAHWLMLDADTYVDWTDATLQAWVAKDLSNATNTRWRFVVYHHPGFNSSIAHFEEQQMRLLSPIFEKGKVDIVFSGHVHNYQRSFPMHFAPANDSLLLWGGKSDKAKGSQLINGKWKLDKSFDGKTNTIPDGVIYIVTGAGGQHLYNTEQENAPDTWQKFTNKFISTVHSFTVVDINAESFMLRQLSADGSVLDSIKITK